MKKKIANAIRRRVPKKQYRKAKREYLRNRQKQNPKLKVSKRQQRLANLFKK